MKSDIWRHEIGYIQMSYSVTTHPDGTISVVPKSARHGLCKKWHCPACDNDIRVRRNGRKGNSFYLSKCSWVEEKSGDYDSVYSQLYPQDCHSTELKCPYCGESLKYTPGRGASLVIY